MKPKHVIAVPAQPPRKLADDEPVLNIELPREVVAPDEFADVNLVPAGDREIVPTGLASPAEVLKTGLGLFSVLSALKHGRSHRVDRNGAHPLDTA